MPVDAFQPSLNAFFRAPSPGAPQTDGAHGVDGKPQAGQVGNAQKAGKAVTPGMSEAAGPVPDPSTPQTGNHVLAAAVMASLLVMMPTMSSDDADVELASLAAKMKDATDKSDKSEIQVSSAQKQAALRDKEAVQHKAEEAHKKAEETHKKASIADKIKLAFSFVSAILTIAAGVLVAALAPVTGGLALAATALLIASGAIMLGMAIDQTMATASADKGGASVGWVGMMAKAIAKDIAKHETSDPAVRARLTQKLTQEWTMGLQIALTGAAAIMGIAGAVINPLGGEAAISMMAKTAEQALAIAGAANDIADGAVQIASSAFTYQATKQEAANVDLKGQAKGLDAVGKMLDGMIDAALARLSANGNRFSAVLDSIMSAMQDRSDVMSHAQFRA